MIVLLGGGVAAGLYTAYVPSFFTSYLSIYHHIWHIRALGWQHVGSVWVGVWLVLPLAESESVFFPLLSLLYIGNV
jgi:hypothetical protein